MAEFINVNILFLLILTWTTYNPALCQQQILSFPLRVAPTISTGDTCPAQGDIDAEHRRVRHILREGFATLPCLCGANKGWRRVAYLNMSDPNQQCPSNWNLTTSSIRGCGRSSSGFYACDSVLYSVQGVRYSSVCGRVIAYQRGVGAGFYRAIYEGRNTTDSDYVAGVSITHGPAGSRQHIWTFAAALSEQLEYAVDIRHNCPCTNTSDTWPYQIPSFVGSDYFCDTGIRGPDVNFTALYTDNPLWDGEGCGSTSSCCEFNTPPWFCKSLSEPTSDDIDVRLCNYFSTRYGEDKVITLIDIFVQ